MTINMTDMFFLKKTLALALGFFILQSCTEEFTYRHRTPELLEVESDEMEFTSAAGSASLTVESAADWQVTPDPDAGWLSVKKGDGTLDVSVSANDDIFARDGVVTVSSGSSSLSVKVRQKPLGFYFTADAATQEVGYGGQTVGVDVDTDLSSWEAVSSVEWIVLPEIAAAPSAVSFNATVEANHDLSERMGDIDFYRSGVLVGRVTLTQKPVVPTVEFPLDEYVFESPAFSESIEINSNYKWSASVDAAGSTWLELLLPQAGEDGLVPPGPAAITIRGGDAVPAREAKVTFVSGQNSFVLTVRQNGVPTTLSADKTSLNLPWTASSGTFTITTNNAWEITDLPGWATAVPSSGGDGSSQVTVSCDVLNNLPRTGEIEVKAGDKTLKLTINQAGGPFEKTIVFADGTNVFRDVLTPELKSSTSKANNLGIVTERLTADPDYVMQYYSRGRTLASLTSSGIRIQVEPASGQSTSKALRAENFAFVKFPGYEGYKMTKISIYFVTAGYVFVTSTYGSSNDEARAAALTDPLFRSEIGKVNDLVLDSPAENTPYYLFFPETNSGEIRMFSFAITYTPVD